MERTLEDNVRRLLQEISEDLCSAIGESPAVSEKLSELQAAGYSLNLLLDCREIEHDRDEGFAKEFVDEQSAASTPPALTPKERQPMELRSKELGAREQASKGDRGLPAEFRIDASDLAFLRSVGIDPTRAGRSKRRRNAESITPSQGG